MTWAQTKRVETTTSYLPPIVPLVIIALCVGFVARQHVEGANQAGDSFFAMVGTFPTDPSSRKTVGPRRGGEGGAEPLAEAKPPRGVPRGKDIAPLPPAQPGRPRGDEDPKVPDPDRMIEASVRAIPSDITWPARQA